MGSYTVLQSSGRPSRRTNPFISQLFESLDREGVTVLPWSWVNAITKPYDVVQCHWPEFMLRGVILPHTILKYVLFCVFLVRIKVARTPVVQTVHNKEPHETGNRLENFLLNELRKSVVLEIVLNDEPLEDRGVDRVTILHGHYTDWYAAHDRAGAEKGRIAYFGMIRPYKGVEGLVTAFRAIESPDKRLHVLGRPKPPEIADTIEKLRGGDARIETAYGFSPEPELALAITRAELVVLPYNEMYNSGSVLLALSLGRPVLVPWSLSNEALSAEVGAGWVRMYTGALDSAALEREIAAFEANPPAGAPDLSRRSWDLIARQHVAAFDAARAKKARR